MGGGGSRGLLKGRCCFRTPDRRLGAFLPRTLPGGCSPGRTTLHHAHGAVQGRKKGELVLPDFLDVHFTFPKL